MALRSKALTAARHANLLQPLNKDDKRELAEVIRTMDIAIAAIEKEFAK